MLNLNEANFEQEVLQSDKLTIVDFWASWCRPCRALAPILDEIDEEMGDQVKITKVDCQTETELPQKYGIGGIPTLLFFKEGEQINQLVGLVTKEQLKQSIQSFI